ncbi:hypothetical protein [Streptomyces sp. NPDC048385]|uniref:hypothetical protein n=1 Tax=unclassified Streptomyces TaxID=2593676 RepID=UPI00341B96F7
MARPEVITATQASEGAVVQSISRPAYAVGNEDLFVARGDEATGLTRGLLAAGIRDPGGGRARECLAGSV